MEKIGRSMIPKHTSTKWSEICCRGGGHGWLVRGAEHGDIHQREVLSAVTSTNPRGRTNPRFSSFS